MTIRRELPEDQGEIGLTDAIAWFTRNGWTVRVPLVDNQRYDLIVDDGTGVARTSLTVGRKWRRFRLQP